MSRRLSVAGLVFAWLCAQGALTESIQVFAWTRMFSGYVKTMSWQAALTTTFDPAKPCNICCAIKKARETERRSPEAPSPERDAGKLVLALEIIDDDLTPPAPVAAVSIDDPRPAEWRSAVPKPPPRLA